MELVVRKIQDEKNSLVHEDLGVSSILCTATNGLAPSYQLVLLWRKLRLVRDMNDVGFVSIWLMANALSFW